MYIQEFLPETIRFLLDAICTDLNITQFTFLTPNRKYIYQTFIDIRGNKFQGDLQIPRN